MSDALKNARAVLVTCLDRHVFTADEQPHIRAIVNALAPVAAPPEKLVDELNRVFMFSAVQALLDNRVTDEHGEPRVSTSGVDAGIRAIVSALARRGAEGLSSVTTIAAELATDVIADSYEERAEAVLEIVRAHVAPAFAARDAVLAETGAENERLSRGLGALGAMLALYGLPSEPKALARELDGRRASFDAVEKRLAAVLALDADDIEEAMRAGEERAAEQGRAKGKAIWRADERRESVVEVLFLVRSRAAENNENAKTESER